MNSSKQRRIVPLIELLAKYSSLFGIVPWYSFEHGKLMYSKICKCYSILLTVVVSLLSLILTFMRFIAIYHRISPVFVVENVGLEIAGVSLFIVITSSSSTWNLSTWERLFRKIQKMEIRTVLYGTREYKYITLKHNILFALGNTYLVSLFILDFGRYVKNNRTGEPCYFISTLIFRYTEFITSFLIFSIVIIMKHMYKEINWICHKNNVTQENVFKIVETVRKLYLKMSKLSQIFNKLFGWPILLIYFFSTVQLLNCLSFVNPMRADENVFEHTWQLSTHLLYALEITVSKQR